VVSNFYPANDQSRLTALRRFERLDNSPEPALDSITAFVAWFYKTTISAIALTSVIASSSNPFMVLRMRKLIIVPNGARPHSPRMMSLWLFLPLVR